MHNMIHLLILVKIWIIKHSEEIGGTCLALVYKLLDGNYSLSNINLSIIAEKLITEAPSMFLAGFMGGLGGLSVRWIFARFSQKKDEPEA